LTAVGSVISDVAKRGITTRQLQKVWAEVVRDCSQWENSTREYTEETRGQFQWNLEPKEDGTKIDPTVYSTPSKKVRCML
jgi:hypothetical protein